MHHANQQLRQCLRTHCHLTLTTVLELRRRIHPGDWLESMDAAVPAWIAEESQSPYTSSMTPRDRLSAPYLLLHESSCTGGTSSLGYVVRLSHLFHKLRRFSMGIWRLAWHIPGVPNIILELHAADLAVVDGTSSKLPPSCRCCQGGRGHELPLVKCRGC